MKWIGRLSWFVWHALQTTVWTLGILLYALVAGSLPFDDPNPKRLLQKMRRGAYAIPNWVSVPCEHFIGTMPRDKPEERITLRGILEHPYLKTMIGRAQRVG